MGDDDDQFCFRSLVERQCFSFRNYLLLRLQAVLLQAHFKAHLLLGLSLSFSAIPPTAAGIVPRLRESTWTARNVVLFSFCNFNLNVCAAHRVGSPSAMRKTAPETRVLRGKLGEKNRVRYLAWEQSHTQDSNPGPYFVDKYSTIFDRR